MRFGDWRRGVLVTRKGWRVTVEWWGYSRSRFRVWRVGPLTLVNEVPV